MRMSKPENGQFLDFLNSNEKEPSRLVDAAVLFNIKQKLNPFIGTILFKLSLIHSFVGIITMTFCPQFKMSLTADNQMFHYFHLTFGYYGCLAICGVVFMGSGALFASQILNRDEVRTINAKFYFFFPCLCLISLSIFLLLGARPFIDIILSWSLGGILGSIFIFYFASLLKRNFFSRLIY
jgi:hypothetical protein